MAKESVNVVERHVEKGIVGVCGAVLLAVIVLFGVSTPNTVEIEGEKVGPGQVDAKVLEVAEDLANSLRRARADPVEVENPVPKFEEALSPLAYAEVPSEIPPPAPLLPKVPSKFGSTPIAGEIELADVLPPQPPKATHARATLSLPPPALLEPGQSRPPPPTDAVEYHRPVNWVTVAAVFNQQEQMSVYAKAGYPVKDRNPYVVGVDLQRREKSAGDTYGEWVNVNAYMPYVLPRPPEIEIVPGRRGGLIPTEDTQEAVTDFRKLVRRAQVDIMRPLFPEVIYGDGWLYPKFPDVNVRALDLELCSGNDCEPRPYPPQKDESEEDITLEQQIEEMFSRGRTALNRWEWDEAERIADEIESLLEKEGGRLRLYQERIAKLRDDAGQGRLDEARGRLKRKDSPDDEDEETLIGRRSPQQLVWAHDAADELRGGAESGKTYQYRMRLRLLNPFMARPQDLKDPDDAQIVGVPGEWSNPTPDLYIEPDTAFFLTRGNINTRSGVKVTVFKWFEGVWVEETFSAEIGEPLGGSSREVVRVLDDGERDRPLVDFDTGQVVVDIDYDYQYRPTESRGRNEFTVAPAVPTVALVYADRRTGRLEQKIYEADKASEQYKAYKDRVFEPPRRRR